MEDPGPALEASVERLRVLFGRGGLLSSVGRLLLGVSGGADSTALACLVHDVLRSRKAAAGRPAFPAEVLIGHVHHGLRGVESDEDEAFARELARRLGFRFVARRLDVARVAEEEGLSVETAARRLRYDSFRRWAESLELDAVAVAHTRDDQQETVLLRIARGTGIRGLSGMSPERPLEGRCRRVRLLRPLLGWKREELVEYLRSKGQPYREDSSNRCLDIPRNRVRQEVLPLLAAVHPGVGPALERLARLARRQALDLEVLGRRALEEALISRGEGVVVLDAPRLGRWPPSVVRDALVRALAAIDPECPPLSERACERFLAFMDRDEPAGSVDLARGAVAELRYGEISIRRDESPAERGAELPLAIGGGPVCWKGWRVEAERLPWGGETADRGEEWVDEQSIGAGLTVRGRREGDLFHPLGAAGRKKLKEFFRECRVAPRFRDEWPLVTARGEVVWVVGERLAEPFRVRPGTRSTVRLRARRR